MESVTNPEQDIVMKMNTETIQKLKTSGVKYMLIQVLSLLKAFKSSIDFKSNTINWFFTLLTMETGLLMADL